MLRWLLAAALASIAIAQPAATQGKWSLQYFFDEDGKTFRITALAFPSAERGIAVGEIVDEQRGKSQFTAAVTSNGGAKWSLVPLKEFPRSVFFLNDSMGWLITDRGIWFTEESGRSWTRIAGQIPANKKLPDAPPNGLLLRAWFLDAQHGFAAGLQKSVYETRDGGRTWKPLSVAAKPESNPAYTEYTHISFADDKHGIIIGGYRPPGARNAPDPILPGRTALRRERPLLAIELDTKDGGESWGMDTAPILGTLASLRLSGRSGLSVFQYGDPLEWPSEVYRLDLRTGKSESIFRQKDRMVTDAIGFDSGRVFLAAYEPPGRLRSAPIPGKVKMLTSADAKSWVEMEVDYRAVAGNVILAGPDAAHLWAATDTGMILHLEQNP